MDFRDITEFIKDTSQYILIVIIVLLLFIFVVGLNQVIGPSMEPNLYEDDIVIVNKLLYRFKDINRNDVVIIKQNEKYMIKRIIGLPNEYIEYKDGYLYVDGNSYKESFETTETDDFNLKDIDASLDKIPEDMYLVLGDNRMNSSDSRSFGLIEKEQIVGKAWIKIWPFSDIKFIK